MEEYELQYEEHRRYEQEHQRYDVLGRRLYARIRREYEHEVYAGHRAEYPREEDDLLHDVGRLGVEGAREPYANGGAKEEERPAFAGVGLCPEDDGPYYKEHRTHQEYNAEHLYEVAGVERLNRYADLEALAVSFYRVLDVGPFGERVGDIKQLDGLFMRTPFASRTLSLNLMSCSPFSTPGVMSVTTMLP